jgi:hypothetical protein
MSPMSSSINVLLAIGVLANLIKGGDLVLRDYQKKKLQGRFESFTLWFDDLRPIRWLSYLPNPKPAFWWSVLSAVSALIAPAAMGSAIEFVLELIFNSAGAVFTEQHVQASIIRRATLVGLLFAIPASILVIRRFSRPLIKWLVGDTRFWKFLARLILFYAASVAALEIFGWFCRLGGSSLPLAVALVALWPFTFIIYFLNVTGFLIATLYMLIWPLNWAVKLVGAICWRIAEYSQGVLSAFLLIGTIALGLTKLLIERR